MFLSLWEFLSLSYCKYCTSSTTSEAKHKEHKEKQENRKFALLEAVLHYTRAYCIHTKRRIR